MQTRKQFFMAIFITILYFLIHFAIINDYGLSWDFHYHFYAGLYHLGIPVPKITDPPPVPFTSPDPRLTVEDPFGPITQILPTISYLFLHEKWHVLPFDNAYNFPMVLIGSFGVGLLYFISAEIFGGLTALGSSLFLAFLPNYWGYLHNNMKDIPNAFFFTLSVYFFWKLEKSRTVKNLIYACFTFSLAFNTKINSVFIPVVNFIYFTLTNIRDLFNIFFESRIKSIVRSKIIIVLLFFIIGPLLAITFWWPFWRDPWGKLLSLPQFYSFNTYNMPVLLFGKIFRSGINVPWFYPYLYLGITTPILFLALSIFGLIITCYKVVCKNKNYLFLLIWFFVPLFRYLSPKSGAIDGIRHFMEVVYPFSLLAGIGFAFVVKISSKLFKNQGISLSLVGLIVFIPLIVNIIKYHPYQTSFFNILTGGIKGANGKFDIDFWGTPQKEAILYLNKTVPEGSFVNVVMAQSTAGVYLREDLRRLQNLKNIAESDYVVILNRQSFWSIYPVWELLQKAINENKLVYKKEIDGVPLVWVIKK